MFANVIVDFFQNFVDNIVCWFQTALVLAANAIVVALGVLWGAMIDLLPDMPAAPVLPGAFSTALGYLNWMADVPFLVGVFAATMALYGAWRLVEIPLRWVKVIE